MINNKDKSMSLNNFELMGTSQEAHISMAKTTDFFKQMCAAVDRVRDNSNREKDPNIWREVEQLIRDRVGLNIHLPNTAYNGIDTGDIGFVFPAEPSIEGVLTTIGGVKDKHALNAYTYAHTMNSERFGDSNKVYKKFNYRDKVLEIDYKNVKVKGEFSKIPISVNVSIKSLNRQSTEALVGTICHEVGHAFYFMHCLTVQYIYSHHMTSLMHGLKFIDTPEERKVLFKAAFQYAGLGASEMELNSLSKDGGVASVTRVINRFKNEVESVYLSDNNINITETQADYFALKLIGDATFITEFYKYYRNNISLVKLFSFDPFYWIKLSTLITFTIHASFNQRIHNLNNEYTTNTTRGYLLSGIFWLALGKLIVPNLPRSKTVNEIAETAIKHNSDILRSFSFIKDMLATSLVDGFKYLIAGFASANFFDAFESRVFFNDKLYHTKNAADAFSGHNKYDTGVERVKRARMMMVNNLKEPGLSKEMISKIQENIVRLDATINYYKLEKIDIINFSKNFDPDYSKCKAIDNLLENLMANSLFHTSAMFK